MKKIGSVLTILITLLTPASLLAQSALLSEKPIGYPQVNLFMHLDKNIYQPGENIWFSGYIINHDKTLKAEQNTLYAILVDAVDRKLVAKSRFAILYGIARGSLSIPDTLSSGVYWVLGYTNAWIEHGTQPLFKQLITVRTGVKEPFRISSTLLPSTGDDTVRVRYRVSTSYNGLASGGKFEYTIYDDSKPVGSGSKMLDPSGEITLPFNSAKTSYQDLQITAKVTRNGLSRRFILPVTIPSPVTVDAGPSGPSAADQSALISDNALSPANYLATSQPPSAHIVSIESDSAAYDARHKVTLHIRVRDAAGNPVPAIFSMSVVAAKRIDTLRMASISSFTSAGDTLFVQPGSAPPLYTHATSANDRLPDSGYVLFDGHSPHRAVSLTLMGNSLATLNTDTAGRFQLPATALLASPMSGPPYLSVAEKDVDRYKIIIASKADGISEQLASTYHPVESFVPDISDTADLNIPTGAGVLQTATVKAKRIAEYEFTTGEYNSRHCESDFVCTHHHSTSGFDPDNLNCPWTDQYNCRLEKPVEGHEYTYIPDTVLAKSLRPGIGVPAVKIIYHCSVPYLPPFVRSLDPILLEKPFPAQDSCTALPLGTGFQPTEFWLPPTSTAGKEEVTVSFYTNKLPGKFICRLQGLSTKGPIEYVAVYSVRPPKN